MEPYIDQEAFVRDHCCLAEGQVMTSIARLVQDMTQWLAEMPRWKTALYWVTHLWPVRRFSQKRWSKSFDKWRYANRYRLRSNSIVD